jgi:hypothetical protein
MRAIFSSSGSMSDLPDLRQLKRARCQLPVSRYCDPGIFAQEKRLLFDAGPYHSPMEDSMVHFHEWRRRKLRP